jgi:hypothetical protein
MATNRDSQKGDSKRSVVLEVIGLLRAVVEKDAVKWLCLAFIAWIALDRGLGHLAGRRTFADVGIRFVGDLSIREGAAYIVAVGAVIIALYRERLRRDTIQRLANNIAELQKKIDPGRSSSDLTPRGTTRPGDRP